jgi:hypothetical protein
MLSGKELPGYLGPNPGSVSRRDRGVDRVPDRGIESSDPLGHLDPERRRIVHDFERCPQPHHVLEVSSSEVRAFQLLQPQQSAHLLRRHRVADIQTVDTCHAGTDPHPGRLAPLGVIRSQPGASLVGRVQGSDLPGQIVITRPGAELVQAHSHTPKRQSRPPRRSPRPGVPSVSALGVSAIMISEGLGYVFARALVGGDRSVGRKCRRALGVGR